MNGAVNVLENEAHLVVRSQDDPAAFVPLYDYYFPRVYSYVRYRLGDADAAADVVASTFERAYANLPRYDARRGAFSTWLFTIARNAMRNYQRRQWVRRWLPLDAAHGQPAVLHTPEQAAVQQELIDQVLGFVSALPEREQEILALRFGAKLSNRQIAAVMGLSDSNVGVILYRTIRTLREKMEANDE